MRIGTRIVLAAVALCAAPLLPKSAQAWPDRDDPFTLTVDDVGCRSGRAEVTLHNQTSEAIRFDLQADGESVATGSIPARKTIARQVRVRKGSAAEIEAYSLNDRQPGTLIDSSRVRNDCPWGHHRGNLPFTGPPTDLIAKLATAGGLIVMGGILWWYGSIWPRSTP
ncbi:hypothetical protein [Nonomuraea sp. CA-141351]|uniref:hypothetical protein n=1 Tax=Nonomuraea sp. CA-141351 TaxID=3239996 RepID=UPI003D8F4FE6